MGKAESIFSTGLKKGEVSIFGLYCPEVDSVEGCLAFLHCSGFGKTGYAFVESHPSRKMRD
jgi:hypothetical protein